MYLPSLSTLSSLREKLFIPTDFSQVRGRKEEELGHYEEGWREEDQEAMKKGEKSHRRPPLCLSLRWAQYGWLGNRRRETMGCFHIPRIWSMTV